MEKYTRRQLSEMPTLEQSWDGDELKIHEEGYKVWLSSVENRPYNGDYTIERLVDGKWEQQNVFIH